MIDKIIDRVRSMGEYRVASSITLILLTLVNAINVAFFQVSFLEVVLGIIILIVWGIDMRLMYLSRMTNPMEVWDLASDDAKRLPIALTVLISLFGFYAFGWLHMGLWVWVMSTYAGIQLAYKLLLVVMLNDSDKLSSYIKGGTYIMAIVVSLFGIASVNNDMKGLPMLGFVLCLVPFIAGIIGRTQRSFFALKIIWMISMWGAVACHGSVIAAIIATVLFGMMMSFNSTVTTSQHRSDNVIPFRTRDGRTVNPHYSRDDNETIIEPDKNFIGILLPKFHPYFPYTFIPNIFRTIWVKQTQDQIELFDKRLMFGENSTDLALLAKRDIDISWNPILEILGFFHVCRVDIKLVHKDDDVIIASFYVSKNLGEYIKVNIDHWAQWTRNERGISQIV